MGKCSKCSTTQISNRKYMLCDDCNYYRLHGESKQEAYFRKQKERVITGRKEEVKLYCTNHSTRLVLNRKYRLCEECNSKRLQSVRTPVIKPKKDLQVVKKKVEVDLDREVFLEIWKERPHISEVSGLPLGDFFSSIYCSHILTKGAYGRMRRVKENIKLVTPEEHQEWEFGDREKLREDQKWEWVFKKEEELKQRYYQEK